MSRKERERVWDREEKRKRDPEPQWITATFTTILAGQPTGPLELEYSRDIFGEEWEMQEILLSEKYRCIMINSVADICADIWVNSARVVGGSSHSLPTPPLSLSDERCLELAEDGVSKMMLDAQGSPMSSFSEFLFDISSRLHLLGSHIIVSLILLERLRLSPLLLEAAQPDTTFTVKCGSQAFIFCLLMSHKLSEDRAYDNRTWAHLTRYSVDDINKMERRLLCLLEHRLFVERKDIRIAFDNLDFKYGWRNTLRQALLGDENTGYHGRRRQSRAL